MDNEEFTLVILKPDCIRSRRVGDVILLLERENLRVDSMKTMTASRAIMEQHYSHVKEREFYEALLDFMTSSPVIVMILKGPNAVIRVRAILGTTDPRRAEPHTIRGRYGKNIPENIAHASDSHEAAEMEIRRFFGAND